MKCVGANAGDALHLFQWEVLFDNYDILKPKQNVEIGRTFRDMLLRTAQGQMAELALRDSYDLTETDVLYIMDGKTGYYTFAGPMRLGSLVTCRLTPRQRNRKMHSGQKRVEGMGRKTSLDRI